MSDPVGMNEPVRGGSVRFRLLAIALLPMLVILPLLLGVAIYRWNARFDAALTSKVHGDLTIAHQYLARILEKTGVQMRALSLSSRLRDATEQGTPSALQELLEQPQGDWPRLPLPDERNRRHHRLVTGIPRAAEEQLADRHRGAVGQVCRDRRRHL
jgi:hypothetical protein